MPTNNEELLKEIKSYNRYIVRNPKNDNAYYRKAEILKQLGQVTGDKAQYEEALICYSKAIELNKESALYLVARSRLYVDIGKSEEAIQDIRNIHELPTGETNPIYSIYIRNTQRDILKLDSIKNQIEQLRSNGKISPELSDILEKHANITAILVVQVGVHSEKLEEHSEEILEVNNRQKVLESQITINTKLIKFIVEKVQKGEEITQTEIGTLTQNTEIIQSKLKELQEEKVGRNELEPHVFKVSEEISINPKLKDYYDAIYDKLFSNMTEAIVICGGGHIAIDSSKLVVKAATAPIRLIPKAGSVASVVSGAAELREGNKIKEKAVILKSINLNPDDRQSILKKVAAEVTLKKAKAIQDINSDNQELHDWQQASIIQTVKNKFMFNIDAETYKTPQQILGCVDALKILWVISKGRVSSNNTEKQEDEVIKQLIAIPTSYTLTVKSYPIVGKKVYSPIKIVLSDILGCEDEEIDVEESDNIASSDVVATATSTTTAPLATVEDDDVSISGDNIDLM